MVSVLAVSTECTFSNAFHRFRNDYFSDLRKLKAIFSNTLETFLKSDRRNILAFIEYTVSNILHAAWNLHSSDPAALEAFVSNRLDSFWQNYRFRGIVAVLHDTVHISVEYHSAHGSVNAHFVAILVSHNAITRRNCYQRYVIVLVIYKFLDVGWCLS